MKSKALFSHPLTAAVLVGVLAAGVLTWIPKASAQAGPKKESGETVARPRKKDAPPEPELQKIPSKLNKKGAEALPEGVPTFRSDSVSVNVDVAVLDNKGRFIPGIPAGNFRILEDNVPQKINQFAMGEAPMTICMVIEFSNLYQQYWSSGWYETLQASYGFLETLKPEDYVAVVAYDLRPEILSDFATDKRKAYEAMQRLRIAAFSESNLYDALTDTAERMSEIEGRKAIVVISSGVDTFSKQTFDQARKRLQSAGVPIYAIGIMQALREIFDARGWMGPIQRLDFLQADNQMRTFAKESGGMSFFPRFFGEFPGIYGAIHQALRNQYSITYTPTNQAKDGKFRKLKVELVNPATNEPLRVLDEKNKPIKYQIVAKAGYTAPREVE
ncbi:MAG: VWA domain-containing protein [Bryobacter sp.]|jgi:VWFA-related protein|nr:VWA domain-containing protein [Bryobacter sp. CoA8 C33]